MTQDPTSALIVTKPNRTRDSLQALLASIHQIEIVNQVDDVPSALMAISAQPPTLVLLDANLPGNESWATLEQIKSRWPQVRCIVLAGNLQQQWQAKAVGADGVLLAGLPAGQFFATIEAQLFSARSMDGMEQVAR